MAKRRRLSAEDYAVGWVCALPIELAAAQEMLDELHEDHDYDGTSVYTLGRIGEHNVVIACLPKGQTGTNSAATAATRMQSTFPSIRFGLMVGIGGGVPSADADIRLGDVVVSQPGKLHGGVVQYDFGKSTPAGFERTGFVNGPPRVLLDAAGKLQANYLRGQSRLHENIAHFDGMPKFARANAGRDVLFEADYPHVGGSTCERCSEERMVKRPARDEKVVVHYGAIASGNQVMRDGNERDRISSEFGGILCFEMEAAGLMDSFSCLVIRGICDYADSHKNKTWQPYAAGTAAAYAKELLSLIPPSAITKTKTVLDTIKEKQVIEETLNQLPYAVEAPFNAYQRQNERPCLPNTRVNVLEEIDLWANAEDGPGMFWLSGMAGTGKSTIARTVARTYFDKGRLGASFFFTRGGGDVGHSAKFVTTIARQLANSIMSIQPSVCEAVIGHGDTLYQSLSDQWRQFIIGPLSKLDSSLNSPVYILVVDALDECDDERAVRVILRLLTETLSVANNLLRVFITSRPELPIQNEVSRMPTETHSDLILHRIEPEVVDRDIAFFLERELQFIAQELFLDPSWPGPEAIKRLTQNACGLFIWCVTACRFIFEGNIFAGERLDILLEGNTSISAPEKHLDEIYLSVLRSAIHPSFTEQERNTFYRLLNQVLGSVVILSSPLPIGSLCKLLHVPTRKINQVLAHLHAILDIPDQPSRPLRLHHPSFRDFLLDPNRCADAAFQVEEDKAHRELAEHCLRLMSSNLKQDICGVGSPGTSINEVEYGQIQQCILPEVQYACVFWVHHLQKSSTFLKDDDAIHEFLNEHCLHWLEALSWIHKLREAILAIMALESIASKSNCPQLRELFWDIKRLTRANQSIMEEAPLQIYFSALVFAPSQSVIRNKFRAVPLQWIKKLPVVRTVWSSLIQIIETRPNFDFFRHMVFSPDGKMLAVVSRITIRLLDPLTGQCLQTIHQGVSPWWFGDIAFSCNGKILTSVLGSTIKVWDTSTGQCLQALDRHTDQVNCMAFSCTEEILASASKDQTVILWNLSNGQYQKLEHTGQTHAVAFSPSPSTANILALASDDHTIKIWDSVTGKCQHILKSDRQQVRTLVFSRDGKILASASDPSIDSDSLSSDDRTVHIWDLVTRKRLQTLEGHTDRITAIRFSPDGRILISSSWDSTIRVWNVWTGICLHILSCSGGVIDITISSDGKILASVSFTKVQLWDPWNGQRLQTLTGHHGIMRSVSFSPSSKGTEILASASDCNVKLWDISTERCQELNRSPTDKVYGIMPSPDGTILASIHEDDVVRIWDISTERCIQRFVGHTAAIGKISFSLDGKKLASASADLTIRLWDLSRAQCQQILEVHDPINILQFSYDKERLVSVHYSLKGGMMKLWDLTTRQCLQTFEGDNGYIDKIYFSPDGRNLASTSVRTVRLWDISTGQCLQILQDTSSIAFSLDGKKIASYTKHKLRLWNVSTGQCLYSSFVIPGLWMLCFSHDGTIIALTSVDGYYQLMNPLTKQCSQIPDGLSSNMTFLSFSQDDRYLRTNRGTFDFKLVHEAAGKGRLLQVQMVGLFVGEEWISWNGKNMLWLPPDYRPSDTAVYENAVALLFDDKLQMIFINFTLGQ